MCKATTKIQLTPGKQIVEYIYIYYSDLLLKPFVVYESEWILILKLKLGQVPVHGTGNMYCSVVPVPRMFWWHVQVRMPM